MRASEFQAVPRRTFLQAAAVGAAGLLLPAGPRPLLAAPSDAPQLMVHSKVPMNAEPDLGELVESYVTPNERFYIRSHAPVPEIDPANFQLSVEGLVERPMKLSLREIQEQFPRRTELATLTCAGNRRSEHSLVKAVSGVPWGAGAIGNARWTGAPLAALLQRAGLKADAKHVWFEGLDEIERTGGTIPFGGSIPVEKALQQQGDLARSLVAYEMNGQPLPPDHGFPLRTIVPGYIGARSVKWLGRIVVSDRPSPNHYVATAYKLVVEGSDAEWAAADPLYQYPLNAVICVPQPQAEFRVGRVRLRGYALPHGDPDRTVTRVDVSADGGQSWTAARLTTPAHPFCWTLWEAQLDVRPTTQMLLVRATDSSGQQQPEEVPWNLKGYMFNAWHKVPVVVQ